MKPYCGILSLPHSCTSPTVVVSAGAMSVKELCWQNCKNTRSQGEASTPCKNTRSQGEASTPCKNTRSQREASTPCKNTRSQGEESTPCKNTRSQGEESTPCMYQRMQYYFGCLCLNPSSATGRRSTWKEYLYYSTTSTQTPYNPLYRLDIPSRKTHGECRRGERKREREVGRG